MSGKIIADFGPKILDARIRNKDIDEDSKDKRPSNPDRHIKFQPGELGMRFESITGKVSWVKTATQADSKE